jgi:hypothetical protein
VVVYPVVGAPTGHSVEQQLAGSHLHCDSEHWRGMGTGQLSQHGFAAQQVSS